MQFRSNAGEITSALPTLTPLSTEWVALTIVFEDSAESEVPIVIRQETSTPTPNQVQTTPTPSPVALVQPSTPTIAPTSTTIALPQNTPAPTPLPEALLKRMAIVDTRARSGAEPTLGELVAQVKTTRSELLELNSVLADSEQSGSLTCPELVSAWEALRDGSPVYTGREEHQLILFHYNRAVEESLVQINVLYESCQVSGGGDTISTANLDPDAYKLALTTRQAFLFDINNALAWANGDVEKFRQHYGGVLASMRRLIPPVDEGTSISCPSISEEYVTLSNSPKLTPARSGLSAYRSYLDAIGFIKEGIGPLSAYCDELLLVDEEAAEDTESEGEGESDENSAESATSGIPLPEEMLEEARFLLKRAITAMIATFDSLPVPTPAPTLVPVWGRILDTRTSDVVDHYEILVEVRTLGLDAPYQSVTIGDFEMASNYTITVIHRCDQDFFDEILLIDANGDAHTSPKLSYEAKEVCWEWQQ